MADSSATTPGTKPIHDIEATATGHSTVGVGAPFLIVLESPVGSTIGKLIPIEGAMSIGRSADADVSIDDPALSRRHVEIERTDGAYRVRDLGSRNGTQVNGAAIASIPLWPGDQIHIGATLLQFQGGSAGTNDLWIRRALTSSVVALWEHFADSDEIMFSEHVDTALDLSPATLGRQRVPVNTCVHPDDRDSLQRALVAARGGTPLEIELRLQVSASLERWVVMRGHLTSSSSRSVAGTMVDVTALKRREATLTRTALVFESFLDGVALTDQGGRIVDLNSAMAQIFSLVRDATIGQMLFSVVPFTEPDKRLGDVDAAMAATGRWTTTLQTGPEAFFDVLAFPLRTDHGENAGAVWVFRDVSEKQRMEAQIAFLDRLASLGTLSAGVAHEINNPLMFILGNAEVVRDGLSRLEPAPGSEHAPWTEALDDIIEGALRIGTIVQDLKVFSKADLDATPHSTDVRRAIEMAIKMTGGMIRAHAQIVTEIEPVKHAHAIEPRLVQVLVNLLMNAAQSIPSGRDGATITIRARNEHNGIAIEVDDTGKGMSPEVAARAFEPFFTTKPMVGTGLGLSICHGLVTGMGGTISLRSSDGRGTVACIWLRAAAEQIEATRLPEQPILPGRLRVLVVDDEPLLLRTAVRILADHDVVTAGGYAAAVERLLLHREPFDVVLCDLMMPDGTGMDLHARLVAERPEIVPHVVFVTGGAFTERSQDFLRNTANLQLQKPVDHLMLRRIVVEAKLHSST